MTKHMAKWKRISEEEFARLVKESRSFRELASKLDYNPDSGSAISSIKHGIKERNLDTSHFLG